jgi:putative YhdH/YhfP family quinone oxidoreductase
MGETFKTLVVRRKDGRFSRAIEVRNTDDLPAGDLLVRVQYAALNYKDALSATGHKGLTRRYPHTPGIEAAGVVVSCRGAEFAEGDEVIIAGGSFGINTDGGFGQYVRVSSAIARRLDGLTLREGIIAGVAGFTAALSLYKLQANGVAPGEGPVLVTGATGGVGSLAVAILSKAGYTVTAATGKADKAEYLKLLGAAEVLCRADIDDASNMAFLQERWAGVIDTVGGSILATAVKATRYGGSVTTCGLVQSAELHTTVYPFILRGVNLLGIDSVQCPADLRDIIWGRLCGEWKPDNLAAIASECSLEQLSERIDLILEGGITGRTIVNLDR